VSRFNHPEWFKRFWASRYGFAVLLLTATLIISVWLTPLIGLGIARFGGRLLAFPGPLFMCAVMLCAWHGGIGPSLLATVVSALAFHYYFRHSPAHPKPDEMRPLLISISQTFLLAC
jgi:K+-sensing histidine kinase KdpD